MRSAAYWKEYRARNRDKLRAYEKLRNQRRKKSPSEKQAPVVKESLTTQKPRRCMAKDCDSTETTESSIAGMKAWLCKIHQQK